MYPKVIFLILFPLFAFSQAPQKINFQSILRNTIGEVVANKSVSLKISILSGTMSGSSVYTETHSKTTDASGLISLQIGNGTVLSGVFANIGWGNASHFIKLEADFNGGSNFIVLGTQELMSVPYALYASKTDTSSLNLVNRFNSKVNVSDTSSMLNPYLRKADAIGNVETDPVFNSSVAKGITGIDTAYWNRKVNISDTTSMLANYRTGLNEKVNIADTSSLLSNYRIGLNSKAPINNPTFTGTVSGIDKNMVGLGNVDNTTDANKPISTATQTALNSKAPINNPTFTGTVSGITKSMVGLSNVDNTSDVNKPVSTATQTALNLKLNISDTAAMLLNYRNSGGSGLPTTGNSLGNMLYWDGSAWIRLTTGSEGQILKIKQGIPVWVNDQFYCGLTTLSDIDGNSYNTVQIGTQCWTKENLKVTKYMDGTSIPTGLDNATWSTTTSGAYAIYDNNNANDAIYGKLYNWYAVNNPRKLCPAGWHVPSDSEWTILTDYLGGESVAGGKMKSIGTAYWNDPNTGATNESGFSVLPGGYRNLDGSFGGIRNYTYFWSATERAYYVAWLRNLFFNLGIVGRDSGSKQLGISVRCLRD